MNIPKYIDSFRNNMQLANYSSDTIENYCSQLNCFLNAFSHITEPAKINETKIREYLLTSVTANHQRHRHSAIKLFYKIVMHRPMKCNYIPYARKEKALPITLEPHEMQKIISVCSNLKHKSIICLLYGCGLRIGELLNLKISNIDSANKYIYIIKGKGKKDRAVNLDETLLKLLRDYYRQYKPVEFLFNGQSKPQYTESSVNSFLKKYATIAGVHKRIYAHLLRHGYATDLYDDDNDLPVIQHLLGHASLRTTMIYTRISKRKLASVKSPLQAMVI